jgi:hypothetical protein
LHFDCDDDVVLSHFSGDEHVLSIGAHDHSVLFPLPMPSESKSFTDDCLSNHESSSFVKLCSERLVRRASAPSEVTPLSSQSKLIGLVKAFEHCNSLKPYSARRTIRLILRGIELKQPACERLSKCFLGYDVSVLDLAPKVRFDSDSKSYVHCRLGRCRICCLICSLIRIQAIATLIQATTACALCSTFCKVAPFKAER